MRDRDYVKIQIIGYNITVMLISYWYKERAVFDRLEAIADSIPKSQFGGGDFHDDPVGRILVDAGNLYDEFVNFNALNPLAIFAANVAGYAFTEKDIKSRMALDLGRHLKNTKWWKENLPELRSEQKKLRIIKKIQIE